MALVFHFSWVSTLFSQLNFALFWGHDDLRWQKSALFTAQIPGPCKGQAEDNHSVGVFMYC